MVRLVTATWRGIRRVEAADVRKVGGRGGGLALETRESSGSEPAPKIAPNPSFLLAPTFPQIWEGTASSSMPSRLSKPDRYCPTSRPPGSKGLVYHLCIPV